MANPEGSTGGAVCCMMGLVVRSIPVRPGVRDAWRAVAILAAVLAAACGKGSPGAETDDAAGEAGDGGEDEGGGDEGTPEAVDDGAGDDGGIEPYRDPSRPVEERVEDLLGRMTLEEKVEQMHGSPPEGTPELWPTPANERLGIPGFHMVDGPRGVRAGTATTFPVGAARGATFDPDLEERVGRAIGAEAAAKGADVLLAPTINVLRHPRWGRAQETYGEDPFHVGTMGAAFVRGAQEHVIASAKHFAANSIEDVRFTVDVTVDERTLREIYLPHFRRAVDAGVGSVMSAYNKVNGSWCGESVHLLREILKGEWGFDGFVESDWVFGTHDTVGSALGGLDVEMPWPNWYGAPLVEAVRAGDVPEATIDDAARRILRAKFRFGLFDGRDPVDPAVVEGAEHVALALEVARESIVLLRNEAGALPVDRGSLRSLAVVGALAGVANLGDTGSSDCTPSSAVTPLAGLGVRAGTADVVHVGTDTPSATDLDAVAAADAAVVVVGLTAADEGESVIGAGDRDSLLLREEHQALVRAVAARNPRTIVVLEGSGAVTTDGWGDAAPALLVAWYPGMEGGRALADVIFGDVNPSGRLPVAFPRAETDLPPFENTGDEATYGYFHGYRHLDREGTEPLHPFGFGLSYTVFEYADLRLEAATVAADGTVRATVDVRNAGGRDGTEVVQLYVGAPGSAVERAVRELRAFRRVAVGAGETVAVELEFPAGDLAYWDAGREAWVVEPIEYVVEVGRSSRDLPLSARFRVAGP
jgi:beta-glucosidase